MQGIKHTPDTFWAQALRVGSCLEWQGQRKRKGYGYLSYHGRDWRASRLAWVLTNGPIPFGLDVCHTCDNPPCISPEHLFLGTRQENMLDAGAKGRLGKARGQAHPRAKLSEQQVEQIRALALAGMSQRVIGRRFGVCFQHVGRILRRQAWS